MVKYMYVCCHKNYNIWHGSSSYYGDLSGATRRFNVVIVANANTITRMHPSLINVNVLMCISMQQQIIGDR